MKISKPVAIFLSVIFFCIALILIIFPFFSILPKYSTPFLKEIVRIVFLAIAFIIARKFYNYIYHDVENKEGKHEVAVYSDSDKGRKIAVGAVIAVLIIFLVYISVAIFTPNNNNNDSSDTQSSDILHFNNSEISFNYSGDWSIESNNSTDIVIADNYGYYLYIFTGNTDGYSLNEIYNLYEESWEEDKNITIINSTNATINNIPAIESYREIKSSPVNDSSYSDIKNLLNIDTNGTKHYSYDLIMTKNGKYYLITFNYVGNTIDEKEFKLFIDSFKINN